MIKKIQQLLHIVLLLTITISCETLSPYEPDIISEDSNLKDDCDYIVVIGDTQMYTNILEYYPYYEATMDWIWSQLYYNKNIKCVLHVGDITENNLPGQYELFHSVSAPTAEHIPYIACTGNHDYTWEVGSLITDRYSTLFSEYTKFDKTMENIISSFEENHMENIIVKNEINGERIDIISLEFGPRTEVVEWANAHVSANKDIKYIILTHEHLTSKGELVTKNVYSTAQFRNTTTTSPKKLWDTLIKNNDNILSLICGHNGFYAHRTDVNDYSRKIPQVLFNLQTQANGGDGWIQLWEFPKDSNYVNIYVYNTITRQYHPNSSMFFTFDYID